MMSNNIQLFENPKICKPNRIANVLGETVVKIAKKPVGCQKNYLKNNNFI